MNYSIKLYYGFLSQVCQAGHEVTYERRCSKTCKEKKKGPLKELIGGIKVDKETKTVSENFSLI